MLEKPIEKKIKDYLTSLNIYWIKTHGSPFTGSGVPDLLCCWNGKFLAIEGKRTGGKNSQSDEQKIHMRNIRKSGGIYLLVDSLDDVKKEVF